MPTSSLTFMCVSTRIHTKEISFSKTKMRKKIRIMEWEAREMVQQWRSLADLPEDSSQVASDIGGPFVFLLLSFIK